jgi:hypothetical protein
VILTPLALALAVLLHAQAIPANPAIPALAVSANSAGLAFTDITAGCGLDCTLTSGATPSTQILEVKGGGLALIDFDNDGDLDVFVPNGATLADPEHGPGARMFRNDGAMHFSDVTASSAIKHNRWSFGVTVGDVDADGFDDIFIACFGPDVLLRNKGDGTFEDITQRAGVADPRWGTSAAFADLDRLCVRHQPVHDRLAVAHVVFLDLRAVADPAQLHERIARVAFVFSANNLGLMFGRDHPAFSDLRRADEVQRDKVRARFFERGVLLLERQLWLAVQMIRNAA